MKGGYSILDLSDFEKINTPGTYDIPGSYNRAKTAASTLKVCLLQAKGFSEWVGLFGLEIPDEGPVYLMSREQASRTLTYTFKEQVKGDPSTDTIVIVSTPKGGN